MIPLLNFEPLLLQRDSSPDYELMGMLFRYESNGSYHDETCLTYYIFCRKLIELSPSRRDALDRVRHFEQLVSSQAYSGNVSDDDEGTPIYD